MKKISFLNPPPLFVEISQSLLQAVHENDDVELPLERQPDGRLTPACKASVVAALKNFLKTKSWQPRARAFCAIGARGVSLRRLSLPGGSKEEFQQRLLLQIESEFPLSPAELAWGCVPLGEAKSSNGAMARQDLLVAAVKKELVADYHEMLRACGTEPVFTLAALARRNLCEPRAEAFALLDIGGGQCELTVFEKNVPAGSRIISTNETPELLAQAIKSNLTGTKLFISGQKISDDFASRLAASLGGGCQCERLEVRGGGVAQASRLSVSEQPARSASRDSQAGRLCHYECSAAIAGLQKLAERGDGPPLPLRLEPATGATASFADLDWKKWGARVGALVAAVLLLPYAEALLLKPHLEKKIAAFKTEAVRLKIIDRELDFLRDLKQSQPPYIEVLSAISKAAAGTQFESLSFNSHGEVSLRCAFRDGQQVADFRNKLIASGFFTNVVVEEQTPTPNHRMVSVRMTAQENPLPQLQALAASLPAETDDAKPALPGALPPVLRKEPK